MNLTVAGWVAPRDWGEAQSFKCEGLDLATFNFHCGTLQVLVIKKGFTSADINLYWYIQDMPILFIVNKLLIQFIESRTVFSF